MSLPNLAPPEIIEPVDKQMWGELEPEEEKESLATPSGISSVASVLETSAHIELRKDRKKEEDERPKHLYQVLPEVKKSISEFMGSQHGYNLTAVNETNSVPSKRKANYVEVAIDPSELERGLDE
ncbi:unnamed protein product [Rhizopus stolonifer]